MSVCSYCGKSIRYRTINGEKVAIEGKRISFLPDQYNGKSRFVNMANAIMKGDRVADGQYGYLIHECSAIATMKKAAVVGERV